MAESKIIINPSGNLSGAEFQAVVDAYLSGLPAGTQVVATALGNNLLLLSGAGIQGIAGGVARTAVADVDHDVADTDVLIAYATLTAARAVNLPAVADVGVGRTIIVKDESGAATTFDISVTPDGAETIDGVAAAVAIAINYGFVTLYSTAAGWYTLGKLIV